MSPPAASSWRQRMLRALLLTFSAAGVIAYVPGVLAAAQAGLVGVVLVDTLVYASILVACFVPGLSFTTRALMMLGCIYVLGVGLLVMIGPFGTGALWLFSLPVFAGPLLGLRAAIGAVALNSASLLALTALRSSALLAGSGWLAYPAGSLPVLIGNYLLLDTAAAVSVAVLVRQLEAALTEERATREALDAERRELAALNAVVSREMEERVSAARARAALEDQLRQSQKMEAIGRLAGGVAHDFNNVLAAIMGHTALALRGKDDPEKLKQRLQEIEASTQRAASLTQRLLAFSRKQVLQPRTIDVNEAVAELERMLRRLIGEDVELVVRPLPRPLFVRADPTQLQQVLMNLAVNARDAMPRGGRLTIETGLLEEGAPRPPEVRAGAFARLTVTDTGVGMDPGTQAHIFEPFFTTKPPGHGTGLGLSTVYGIVMQSEGHVAVESAPDRGAAFTVLLPLQPAPMAAPAPPPAEEVAPGTETVLVVEDEEMLRAMTVEVLGECGYKVLSAGSGAEALAVAEKTPAVDLVLTDVVMPGMGGREVWEAVSRLHPRARVLFMSGYTDDAVVRHGVQASEVALLSKPFTPDALARRVRAVLDAAAAPPALAMEQGR